MARSSHLPPGALVHVVVGGGLAGLASAVWLAEAGQRVTLLERRGALGGRTVAVPVPELDDVPDNGQHVFASGYEHLMRHLDSVGTRHHVTFPGHMTFRMPGGATRTSSFRSVDRLLLAAEARGWVYWRRRQVGRTSVGTAMLELQAILEPEKEHVLEERARERGDIDHAGDDEPVD